MEREFQPVRKLLVTLFLVLILGFGAWGMTEPVPSTGDQIKVEADENTVILN